MTGVRKLAGTMEESKNHSEFQRNDKINYRPVINRFVEQVVKSSYIWIRLENEDFEGDLIAAFRLSKDMGIDIFDVWPTELAANRARIVEGSSGVIEPIPLQTFTDIYLPFMVKDAIRVKVHGSVPNPKLAVLFAPDSLRWTLYKEMEKVYKARLEKIVAPKRLRDVSCKS